MAFVTVQPDTLKGTGGKAHVFRADWQTYTIEPADAVPSVSECHVDLSHFKGKMRASELAELLGIVYTDRLIFHDTRLLKSYFVYGWSNDIVQGVYSDNPNLMPPQFKKTYLDYLHKSIQDGIGGDIVVKHAVPDIGSQGDPGFGLFARVPITTGVYVGSYCGVVAEASAFDRYAMSYPSTSERRLFVSAAEYGNVMRCINSSTDRQNVATIPVFEPVSGIVYIAVVASHDIAEGAQLFFDYGATYWKMHDHLGANAEY